MNRLRNSHGSNIRGIECDRRRGILGCHEVEDTANVRSPEDEADQLTLPIAASPVVGSTMMTRVLPWQTRVMVAAAV